MKEKLKAVVVMAVTSVMVGCAHLAYYDLKTVSNMEGVKTSAQALYPSLAADQPNMALAEKLDKDLAEIYQRENSKADNVEVSQQVGRLMVTYKSHLDDHARKGKWTITHMENMRENFIDQVDLIIETENVKNRRK